MGRSLPAGSGKATTPANICQHPTNEMKRAGNAKEKWWTCKACQSRWVRRPLEARTGVPTGSEIITFGKYSGHRFEEVVDDAVYTQWVLMTAELEEASNPQIERLARYLVGKEQQAARSEYQIFESQESEMSDTDM